MARIDYAAEGVQMLTPFRQSTAIQDVPQRVKRKATGAHARMNGNQPMVGTAGFGMCASALEWTGASHAPVLSGEERRDVVPMGLNPREAFRGESGSLGDGWLSCDWFSRDASRGGVME